MRLTVPNGFWRLNSTPLVFGVVEPPTAGKCVRRGSRCRIERFWMLFSDNSKEPISFNQSADKWSRKVLHPITVYIVPEWQGLPGAYTRSHLHGEQPFHRALIYILGFAVSLVSLNAFKFFDWFFKSTDGPTLIDPKHVWEDHPDSPSVRTGDKNWSKFEGNTFSRGYRGTYSPLASEFSVDESVLKPIFSAHPTSPASAKYQAAYGSTNITTARRYWRVRSVSESALHPLDAIYSHSPFFWTNATLNCPHFPDGFAQVCVLCWFNSPEGWVFGPTLTNLDHAINQCLDELARSTTETLWQGYKCDRLLLLTRLQKANHPQSGFAVLPVDGHHAQHHVLFRNQCTVRSGLSLKRHSTSQDDPELVTVGSESLPKQPRSCGDGAPSSTPSDVSTTQYLKSFARSTVSSNLLRRPPPSCEAHVTRHASTLAQSNGPLFFNPDSDSEMENDIGPIPQLPSPKSPKQLQLSASCLLSKAADFLLPPTSSLCKQRIQSDPVLSGLVASGTLSQDSHWPRRHQQLGSVSSVTTDGLEYDELYCDNVPSGALYRSATSLSCVSGNSEQFRQAEEAQLLRLIETVSSLLNPKRATDSSAIECAPVDQPAHESTNNTVEFRDLDQKAIDLSSDLSDLEEVLDRLHYKLKATRIGLVQAKDNLDYVWHLRDHLNGSDSESISGFSQASSESRSSLNSGSVGGDLPPQSTTTLPTRPPPPLIACDLQEPPLASALLQVPQFPHSTTDLDASVISESLYTSVDYSEPSHPSIALSDADSGFDRSRSLCSCMTTSLVGQKPTELSINVRLRSSRLRRVRRRLMTRSTPVHMTNGSEFVYEEPVDAEGFVYPELTFDKDGIIDWVERTDSCSQR